MCNVGIANSGCSRHVVSLLMTALSAHEFLKSWIPGFNLSMLFFGVRRLWHPWIKLNDMVYDFGYVFPTIIGYNLALNHDYEF
jgi:hypothetical protein